MRRYICSYFLMSVLFLSYKVTAREYTLITSLYHETDLQRIQEFITCLQRNRSHQQIQKIHILFDDSHRPEQTQLLSYLQSQDVILSMIDDRPTYQYCFDLAAQEYPNQPIVLCNADIFFDETLKLLDECDLSNRLIALTRWNIHEDNVVRLHTWPNYVNGGYSQDVWIFTGPLAIDGADMIQMGTKHCDGRLAYVAHASGLQVVNPCLSIRAVHLHRSGIRHYAETPLTNNLHIQPTHWCNIEDVK